MTFKAGEVRKNLRTKGFYQDSKHHQYLYFYRGGRRTPFYTFTSHGKDSEDVGDNNVRSMKDQLGLASKREVQALVDCSMNEEQYVAALVASGKLPPAGAQVAKPASLPPKRRK